MFNYDIIRFKRAVKIFAYLAKHGMNDTEKLMRNANINNELEQDDQPEITKEEWTFLNAAILGEE